MRKPSLEIWHQQPPKGEFRAGGLSDDFSFRDYLALESRLLEVVADEIPGDAEVREKSRFSRYLPRGTNNPATFPRNWNRSYELRPDVVRGAVLLLHGMSDSPYSLRRIGEIYHRNGFYVLGLRHPGHGTVPAGLLDLKWEDMLAAVKLAVAHLREATAGKGPFHLVGYSTGAALAINYCLDTLAAEEAYLPRQLILFSPLMGVHPLAAVMGLHQAISFIPFFEKSRWKEIEPEYDPFKYNSFTKNAALQTYHLTRRIHRQMAAARKSGGMSRFPPVLAFQSLVDATVSTEAVVTRLFDNLGDTQSELVLFDVNRRSGAASFLAPEHDEFLSRLARSDRMPFRLSLLTNLEGDSRQVAEKTRAAGSGEFVTTPLDYRWPPGMFALSHVAVPFSPDDPVYGYLPDKSGYAGLRIGEFDVRGEGGMLRVPDPLLMRLRCNPFFGYIEKRLDSLLDGEKR